MFSMEEKCDVCGRELFEGNCQYCYVESQDYDFFPYEEEQLGDIELKNQICDENG